MRSSLLLPLLSASLATSALAQDARMSQAATPTATSSASSLEREGAFVSRPVSIGDRPMDVVERGEPFFEPAVAPNPNALTDAEIAALPPVDHAGPQAQKYASLYYTEHADGLWVRGRTYKAHVSESGFTYVPFLGSKAPKNYPASFRLSSATVEGRALELTAKASVRREGDRLILDRGPVAVLYDMDTESVEQSFTFDATGVGTDLVLDLDFTTELAIQSRGGGFHFDGPSGGISYSAAVVFDGAGRSADVPTTLVDGRLRLTVPAAFLVAANGPILVDPVFATYAIDTFSGDQGNVDAAYSNVNDGFTFVYEDDFSGSDVDVYSTTVDSSGVFVSARYIDLTGDNVTAPRVATLASANVQLFVATRRHAATGYTDVVGRTLELTTGTLGSEFAIDTGTSISSGSRPDVGGQFGASGSEFCVVWERFYAGQDADAQRAMIDASGAIISSTALEVTFDRSETLVTISESTGDPATVNRWNIAYRSADLSTGNQSIRSVQLNPTGGTLTAAHDIKTSALGAGTFGELDVSDALNLDGLAPTYIVTYDLYSSLDNDNQAIVCRGTSVLNTVNLVLLEHAPIPLDQAECRLSTTASDFVVTYYEEDPSGSDYKVFSTALDLTEGAYLAVSDRRAHPGDTGAIYAGGAGVASRFSGGNTSSRYVGIGWAKYETSTSEYDIQGSTFFASNSYSPAFQYCYGNPNSTGDRGFLAMYGDRSATGPKVLTASALPLNSFGFFIVGRGMASIPNPGGSQGVLCIGSSIGRYSNLAGSSGSTGTISLTIDPTMLSQPTGPVAGLPGEIWNFQLWHRDFVGGSGASNFTNAVTILFN